MKLFSVEKIKGPKKVLIIIGHPDKETVSGLLAKEYKRGAEESGRQVKIVNLGDLFFDPILRKGYKNIQTLEPDLKLLQEQIIWADHLVVIYPNWWGSMPAIMKGAIDRIFLPGFAFRFRKDGTDKWDGLLSGRSARIIVCMDMKPWKARLMFGDYSNEIRRAAFGFVGIKPARLTSFGEARFAKQEVIAKWLSKVYKLGLKGK